MSNKQVGSGKTEQMIATEDIEGKPLAEDEEETILDDMKINMDESGETTDTCSEKNESKDMDDILSCLDCNTSNCFMWRRVSNNSSNNNSSSHDLVCSVCHMKRLKNENEVQLSGNATSSTNNNGNTSNKNNGNQSSTWLNAKTTKDNIRISKRKYKTNKKFTNGFYGDRIIKNGYSKSRRNLYKRKPAKSADGVFSIIASKSIYHNGLLYQSGDIVCTCDVKGGTYFAQLRGFLQDDFCEKAAVVTWLIPTRRNVKLFDPMLFVPGLDEDVPRPLASFDFVCRAPIGLFRGHNVHLPYQRSQTNLENLIFAATVLNSKEELPIETVTTLTSTPTVTTPS